MNIVITGGSGFIGSSLADKLLAQGHNIINVDNISKNFDIKFGLYIEVIEFISIKAGFSNTSFSNLQTI